MFEPRFLSTTPWSYQSGVTGWVLPPSRPGTVFDSWGQSADLEVHIVSSGHLLPWAVLGWSVSAAFALQRFLIKPISVTGPGTSGSYSLRPPIEIPATWIGALAVCRDSGNCRCPHVVAAATATDTAATSMTVAAAMMHSNNEPSLARTIFAVPVNGGMHLRTSLQPRSSWWCAF